MDIIRSYSFSQTPTRFSPSERTKTIQKHVIHITGFLFVVAFLNPVKNISLLRSPAGFKLEKIDNGFRRLPEAVFPHAQFLNAKFHCRAFTALPVLRSWHSLNLLILLRKDKHNKNYPSFKGKMQLGPRPSDRYG